MEAKKITIQAIIFYAIENRYQEAAQIMFKKKINIIDLIEYLEVSFPTTKAANIIYLVEEYTKQKYSCLLRNIDVEFEEIKS